MEVLQNKQISGISVLYDDLSSKVILYLTQSASVSHTLKNEFERENITFLLFLEMPFSKGMK